MIRTRLFALVVLSWTILFACNPQSSEEVQKDPDGFRGIQWGADIAHLKDMEFVRRGNDERVAVYKRKADTLKMDKADLSEIEYVFFQNKLIGVRIAAQDSRKDRDDYRCPNFYALKRASYARFGPPLRAYDNNRVKGEYLWMGKNSFIKLEYYNLDTCDTELSITSNDMLERIRKEDQEMMDKKAPGKP